MEDIGLKEGIALVKKYNKMLPKEREQIQKQRFFSALFHAREHSELYKELYKNLGVNFFMREVPAIERDIAISFEDMWRCDKEYSLEIDSAINAVRVFNFDRDYRSFILRGSKTAIITATDDAPYMGSWIKSTTVLSVFSPTEELISKLNECKPALLWAYPSTLEKLIYHKNEGNLSIKPVLIIACGEALSDELRAQLLETFECTVQSIYATKELGIVACECQFGNLHVNDDWVLLEPVDNDCKPVSLGNRHSKVLATAMHKTRYPVIKMTLPDQISFINKPCPCGNPSTRISISVGKDDYITLPGTNEDITIHIDDFDDVFSDIEGLISYQLLINMNCNISVRLKLKDENKKPICFLLAEQALRKFLRDKGIFAAAITLDANKPLKNQTNGKFKRVIDCRHDT